MYKRQGYLSFQDEGTASGFPVLGYTAPIAVNNQIDFLAATPVMNQNNGNVTFKLHQDVYKRQEEGSSSICSGSCPVCAM